MTEASCQGELKENGYQESIISKIFRKTTSNYRMSINLPDVECTSEKLRHILRSQKVRSTFYTEKTLRKLLCKPKNQVAAEDKNNIVYEID